MRTSHCSWDRTMLTESTTSWKPGSQLSAVEEIQKMQSSEWGGNSKGRLAPRTRSQIFLRLVDLQYHRLNLPSTARVRLPSLCRKYQLTASLHVMKKLARLRRFQSPIPRLVNRRWRRSNLPSHESLRHKHQLTGPTEYNNQLSWWPARLRLTLMRYHRVNRSHWFLTGTNTTYKKIYVKFNYNSTHRLSN